MKGLTAKEEEIMGYFWEKGPMFVKELRALYDEPKPHFNTLSTIVSTPCPPLSGDWRRRATWRTKRMATPINITLR